MQESITLASQRYNPARQFTHALDGSPPRPDLYTGAWYTTADIKRILIVETNPFELNRMQRILDSTREAY